MVLFRLLQGVFGAALVPLSQAVLLDTYPHEQHGSAMALWGMGVMVGPILGPTLGGWLTENYNWRWVFYINLPFGILAFLGLLTFLHETKLDRSGRSTGSASPRLSLAIGALQLMLDRGESQLVRLDRDHHRGDRRPGSPSISSSCILSRPSGRS